MVSGPSPLMPRRLRLFLELVRFSHTVFALPFVCAYSLTKRFTALAHFWLGASLMLAPLAAWVAVRGPADLAAPAVLGFAVLFWVAGFDILYACQDVDVDRRPGVRGGAAGPR